MQKLVVAINTTALRYSIESVRSWKNVLQQPQMNKEMKKMAKWICMKCAWNNFYLREKKQWRWIRYGGPVGLCRVPRDCVIRDFSIKVSCRKQQTFIWQLPEMVMFYVSPYLIDRTLQDFEELVNAGILQSNDLKQSGVKGVKKLYIYMYM